MRLKNKVAIITGSANGIGLAICEAFLKEGAIVVAGDIDEEKCRAEAERLGRNARTTIENNMTLDHWTSRIAECVRCVSR